MDLGLFMMPSHPPERSIADGHAFDLQALQWADQYGFKEAWIGEHHTCKWEPNPAPDLLIAQAFLTTKNIRIGAGGFIPAYHHPVDLVHRISFLDQISGGRLNLGLAAGALPMDQQMFGTDSETNREMLAEGLDLMIRLFTDKEPFVHHGKYYKAARPAAEDNVHYAHLEPLQKPYPPIGMAGAFSIRSRSLVLCGERGFRPMSLNMASRYTKQHWASVEEGARNTGRVAKRSEWGIIRDVLVADTDEEAWEKSVNGAMGRMFREYFIPLMTWYKTDRYGIEYFAAHDGMTIPEITTEYCAENNWLIGSPDTVVRRIEQMYDEVEGFGTLILHGFDYADDPETWRRSLELLGTEVLPRVKHLTGDEPRTILDMKLAS